MRLPRYLIAGGACAITNNVLVIAFVKCGFGYFSSTCLAFGPVLIEGYFLHSLFTFDTPASWQRLGRYTLAMLGNYPVWLASIYLLCDAFRVSISIAAPVTTGFLFIWNYVSSRWAVGAATTTSPEIISD